MTAYLDLSNVEDARVEEVVRADPDAHGYATRARGPGYLWAQVDKDIEENESIFTKKPKHQELRCSIIMFS